MVAIADRVWVVWREREAADTTPTLDLLLSTAAAHEDALSAVEHATREVMLKRLAKTEAAQPGELEFRAGHCSFVSVPDGIALRIDEGPEDFEGLLRDIAACLERSGIDGELNVYEPPEVVEPPELVDLFEGHLRVVGRRVNRPLGGYLWDPDPRAVDIAADEAVVWCREYETGLQLSIVVGLLPPATLTARDDVRAHLIDGINATRSIGVVYLTSVARDHFRTFAIEPSSGRVVLLEGGAVTAQDWTSSLGRVNQAMIRSARWAAYGYVKRGSRRLSAIFGSSLADDWVPIPHMNPLMRLYEAFEDEFCPDAFGAQLLGPGYRDRVPVVRDWKMQSLRSGHSFLEHLNTAGWFDGSLVPFGGRSSWVDDPAASNPSLVSSARKDFAAILFNDELDARQGGRSPSRTT